MGGDVNYRDNQYITPPFLQPDGVVTTVENPHTASFIYSETRGQKNIPPTFNSSIVLPKSGTIDYASDANKSFVNIHDSWGTSSADTHFINFAAGTGSKGDYNVGHIDTRFHFYSIGDCEYYSASAHNTIRENGGSHFINSDNFYNQLQITDGPAKNVSYTHLNATGQVLNTPHKIGRDNTMVGKRMGKTRFMRFFITADGAGAIDLPRNHVTKFSQPFKEQMVNGTQNTNPGFLPVQYEDYSTASFYRVKVTGGENEAIVRGSKTPIIDSDGKLTYN